MSFRWDNVKAGSYAGPQRKDRVTAEESTNNVLDGVARLWADAEYRELVWDAADWFKGWNME